MPDHGPGQCKPNSNEPRESGHNHPDLKALLKKNNWGRHKLLQRKACCLDPVELVGGGLKRHNRRHLHPKWDLGLVSFRTLKGAIDSYYEDVAPDNLPGWYDRRTDGKEAFELGLLHDPPAHLDLSNIGCSARATPA